jgi:hypothetical protein
MPFKGAHEHQTGEIPPHKRMNTMTASKPRNTPASISTFAARKGYVRIDACVPGAIGHAMTQLAFTSGQVDRFWAVQGDAGGNMLMDATVSAPLATLMLALAKQNGASVPTRLAA